MYRVLVTSKSFAKHNPEAVEALQEKGIEIVRFAKSNITEEELIREIPEYDGLVCGIDPEISAEVIRAGKNLKVIHMNGTGVNQINIEEATKHGVYVGNCPGANATAVAELNLGILIAEARKIIPYSNALREGRWERQAGTELTGKTIGILGLGAIGRNLVELLTGFRMKVLAYDVMPNVEWAEAHNVILVKDPSEIYKEADFISLNLPLFDSTRNIIGKEALDQMKPNAIIVNTARGGLIKTEDLAEAIRSGKIKGAALDAFTEEPLAADSPLRDLDITLTPHLGASTTDTMRKVTQIVCDHLEEVLLHNDGSNMLNAF